MDLPDFDLSQFDSCPFLVVLGEEGQVILPIFEFQLVSVSEQLSFFLGLVPEYGHFLLCEISALRVF